MIQKFKQLYSITIDGITISARLIYNINTNHIGIDNSFKYRKEYMKQYRKNNQEKIKQYQINNKEKLNKYSKDYKHKHSVYKDMLHSKQGSEEYCIRVSCGQQRINRKDFNGFTDKKRPYLIPIKQCIQLNKRFFGCEGHHI